MPTDYGTCPTCRASRMRTGSGIVCPNGHGKILPVPAKQSRAELLATLPEATWLRLLWSPGRRLWRIEGTVGLWRKSIYSDASMRAKVRQSGSWVCYRFTRFPAAEEEAAAALCVQLVKDDK